MSPAEVPDLTVAYRLLEERGVRDAEAVRWMMTPICTLDGLSPYECAMYLADGVNIVVELILSTDSGFAF